MYKIIKHFTGLKLLNYILVFILILTNLLLTNVDAQNTNLPIEIDFDITESNTLVEKEVDETGSIYSVEAFEKNSFVYFHQNVKKNFSKYDGIELNIINYSDEEMKVKLHLQNSLGEFVSCKNDSIVIFEHQGQTIVKKIQENYIVVPKNFNGKLLVPFTSLANDKTLENMSILNNVISIGITLEPQYNLKQKIKFSSVSAYSHEQTELFLEVEEINLIGDTKISVPTVGENIVKYEVTGNINPVIFKLIESDEKINISKDGRLVVMPGVKCNDVILRIMLDNNLVLDFDLEINLDSQDTYINTNGEIVNITTPEEIIEKKTTLLLLKYREHIYLVRISLLIIVISIMYLYYYWNNTSNKNNGKKEEI